MKRLLRPEVMLIALHMLVMGGCLAWGMSRLWPPQHRDPDYTADAAPTRTRSIRRTGTDDIDAHPLFHRSRLPIARPEPEPLQDAEEAQAGLAPPRAAPTLLGIAGEGGTRAALLEDPSSLERKFVRVGQAFAGWTLSELVPRGVRLADGDRKVDLVLLQRPTDSPSSATSPASTPQ